MKLINIYIDNFGKLSDFSYSFSPGLNTICRENSFGKSTLLAFVKSMLFGLDDNKKTRLDENDRKKYEPWQGGAWGGSLTLESGGITYRIERSFDKRAQADTCRIFNTDTGKECFEFENISIGEALLGIDKDGFERTVFFSEKQLSDKCENQTIAAKLSDLAGVDADLGALDEALEILEDERKFYTKQSGKGELHTVKLRLSELEEKEMHLTELQAVNERDHEHLNVLNKDISSLRRILSEKQAEEGKKEAKKELLSAYREALSKCSHEEARLLELRRFFGGTPDRDKIYAAMNASSELARLTEKTNTAITVHEKLGSVASLPSEDELSEWRASAEMIKETERRIEELSEKKAERPQKAKIKLRALPIVISIVSLLSGAILGALVAKPLFAICLLALFILPFSFKKEHPSLQNDDAEAVLLMLRDNLNKETDKLPREIREGDIISNIEKLRIKLREAELREEALEISRMEIIKLRREYEAFLSQYPITAHDPLEEIKEKLRMYDRSSVLLEGLREECKNSEMKYGFSKDMLIIEKEANSFNKEEDEIQRLEHERASLCAKIRRDEQLLDDADEISAEAERLKDKLAEYKARVEIIKKTKNYLSAAKDSMNARYLGKTKAEFEKYNSLITALDEEFAFDTSFSVSKREGGKTKPKEAYSRGLRDLYSFLLRLSLTSSLYDGEQPFIAIDDAFAYYDDAKLERVTKLLSELAKERQIIYMTASKARAPK